MKKQTTLFAAVITCLLLFEPSVAKKKYCEIDWSSQQTVAKSAKKCGFTVQNQGIGKKTEMPKKVAIGSFQLRFDFRTNWKKAYMGADVKNKYTIELDPGIYQDITDSMYDAFVDMLESRGYEVASIDAVKGADSYALLTSNTKAKKKSNFIRTSAHGLKNLTFRGAFATNKLPGLNKDLGTDAVLQVFATVGLRQTRGNQIDVCLATMQEMSAGQGLDLKMYAGFKESKMPGGKPAYQPKAQASVFFNGSFCRPLATERKIGWTVKTKYSVPEYVYDAVSLIDEGFKIGMSQIEVAANK